MDEAALILALQTGDRHALEQVIRLYTHYLTAVSARVMAPNPAQEDLEEVVSDTFLALWRFRANLDPERPLRPWLAVAARNLAISRLREHGRTEPLVQEDWQDRLADNPAVTHEDRMMLEAVLSALSDEERQIVTLHALTGLRHREIAALLGLPLPTVLSKYSRALKKLQLAWKEAD